MNMNPKEIGLFIQSLRKEQGLTQAELSERLHVSPQSVSNWERGESLPDISLLPDLAYILRCSVDAILSGGKGCGGYRRHVTVAQMWEALSCLDRMGQLLGQDHFIYDCIIKALDERMNTTIELAFSDAHIFEVFVVEFLGACARSGDYIDPRDVEVHLKPSRARDSLMNTLAQCGIR